MEQRKLDEALTKQFTLWPRKAFTDFFNEHYEKACHFAWKIVGDEQEAEDITIMAFTKLSKNLMPTTDIAVKQLYVIIRNACLDCLRHEKVEQKAGKELSYRANPADDFQQMDERFKSEAELVEQIYKIIEGLPPGFRSVLQMFYKEGLTTKEIAERKNCSIKTIQDQKNKGIKKVRKALLKRK